MRPRNRPAFTLIEFLIALVIIGFIVAMLVSFFTNPLKQAKTDSAISQVSDGLRQRIEAALRLYSQGKCAGSSCYDDAVSLGALSALPALPSGIEAAPGSLLWTSAARTPGGCGAANSGATENEQAALFGVSDEFCKAYNKAAGLPAEIGLNCADGGADCSVSGSTDSDDFPPTIVPTFCYHLAGVDTNAIVMLGTLPSTGPCTP